MLICMQKINFSTHFFLKILQRNSNLLFWVIWACLVTHTQNASINMKKPLMSICRQEIKMIISTCRNINWRKINFVPHFFFEISLRYANLSSVLWACLVIHTYNGKHQLIENFNFYLRSRNTLHHSLLSWDITL